AINQIEEELKLVKEKISEDDFDLDIVEIDLPPIKVKKREKVLEAIHNIFQAERVDDKLFIKFNGGMKEEIHFALNVSLRQQLPAPYLGHWAVGAGFNAVQWYKMQWNEHIILGTDSNKLISNLGRIKNNKGVILKGNFCKRNGYIRIDLSINSIRTSTGIHILVAQAFISNPENKPYVNHINGIKHDNRAVNLEWVTLKENAERKIFPNIGRDYIEPDLNEEWEEIEVNSQKFKVSSLGRFQLLNDVITQGSLYAGYYRIGHIHKYRVHHLVALVFCPKEEGKKFVNHIDGNSTNNKASNLEWCTPRDNIQHSVRLRPQDGWVRQHAVKQIFDNGSFQEFPSLTEAQRITGIVQSSIGKSM
ncbi:18759_t:CDS:2, partial [Racocetra fulgida]